jgi:hypothetical protein
VFLKSSKDSELERSVDLTEIQAKCSTMMSFGRLSINRFANTNRKLKRKNFAEMNII